MAQSATAHETTSTSMRFIDAHYEMEEVGYSDPEPIIHVFARDEQRQQRHLRIDGFHPYFCVELTEALEKQSSLNNDHRVRRIETLDDDGDALTTPMGGMVGDDVRLAKIYTIAPYHVAQLRENFEQTWEADVLFPDRFAYDVGIVDGFAVGNTALRGDDTIGVEQIQSTDDSGAPIECTVPPRIAYLDIEVAQSDDGPSVVSERGKELADNPITAITVYDNYTRSYEVFVLAHSDVDSSAYDITLDVRGDVTVFTTEWELLSAFASHMESHRYDVATAWNAGFDFPYLINRYFTLEHMDVFSLSPTRGVESMDGGGRFMNGDIEGLLLFDMLKGYEKSQIHELDDSSLATVAEAETDIEKMDVDEQTAWSEDPESFVRYNVVDVTAMVEIDAARGVLA